MVENWLKSLLRRFDRIKVYALVGRSGTGKSFRARTLAHRLGIDLMIDDGLLILQDRILAGRSAKAETNYLKATRTAIFENQDHRQEVIKALALQRFHKILLLGTSVKMVSLIARTLDLPPVWKFIPIEEIASPEEIQFALEERSKGHHVIPLPSDEVRRDHAQIFTESVRIFLERTFFRRRHRSVEKSVVRPVFHELASSEGPPLMTKEALIQTVLHCVDEFDPNLHVKKVQVAGSMKKSVKISLFLSVNYGVELMGNLHRLPDHVKGHLKRYTGVVVEEVRISIVQVS